MFGLTWLSYAAYYLTRKNFSIVKTTLEEQLGVSPWMLGAIDTAYLGVYAAGQVISGGLGDRFGPRRVIGIGMLGSAAMAWLFGASSLPLMFLIAFGVNGLFQSTGWPNNVRAMEPWFGPASRGKVMGFWCTNYTIGGAVAGVLATATLARWGWRAAFFVPAAIVAAVGVAVLLFLIDRRDTPRDAETVPPPIDEVEGPAAARAPLAALLVNPAVWALGLSYFGLKLIRYSLLFWLPSYLEHGAGFERGVAGYLSTFFEIGGVFGAIAIGWASDRMVRAGHGRIRLLVPVLVALALALVLYDTVGSLGIFANAASMALVGFLLFGPDALISGAAAQDLGGRHATASAAGMINGIGSLGALVQSFFTVWVSETFGWRALFHVFVAMAALSAVALLPLAWRRPAR